MTDSEKKMLRQFISGRLEIAFSRLKENAQYQEVCERQRKSDTVVDELLDKLEKDERITVRRHYEGETDKTGYELNELYLQGLYDCVKLLRLLGVFGMEVSL